MISSDFLLAAPQDADALISTTNRAEHASRLIVSGNQLIFSPITALSHYIDRHGTKHFLQSHCETSEPLLRSAFMDEPFSHSSSFGDRHEHINY